MASGNVLRLWVVVPHDVIYVDVVVADLQISIDIHANEEPFLLLATFVSDL